MALLALGLVFPFTSRAWGMVLPDKSAAAKPANTCLAPASFAPLAALPQGHVVAPIDAGAHLLAHTGLSVFSAPYHRNNDGNRFALDAMMAPHAGRGHADRARDNLCPRVSGLRRDVGTCPTRA